MPLSRNIILLVILLLTTPLSAKEINWHEEIGGLKRELLSRHVDLFRVRDSATFCRELELVADRSAGQSILEMGIRLQQVVASLGDPFTMVNYHFHIDTRLILPFECYWFEEGIYVMRCWKEFEDLAGKRLVSINNFPIQQVVDSLSTLISGATTARIKNAVPRMITWSQVLSYFGFAGKTDFRIEVESPDGRSSTISIKLPANESYHISFRPETMPLGREDTKTYFRDSLLTRDRIYYIQYNKCWSREAEVEYGSGASALFMPSFKEFEKKALKTLRRKDIQKLVIDLRYNSGGHSLQGSAFIRKMQKTGIAKKADIYLLLGRKTSSEAIANALEVIDTFEAVTVGENTGGKPNHFSGVNRFVMTTSNLIVSYSTEYLTLVKGDPECLKPSIEAPETFSKYMQGIDDGLEAVRKHSSR